MQSATSEMENPRRVAERRAFARKKRRFLVEFDVNGALCTGFTYDISPSGIFVRSVRLPDPGTFLTANIHLPDNKRVLVRGRVIRSFRVAAALSRLIPSGFSIRLQESPEDYFQFLATL